MTLMRAPEALQGAIGSKMRRQSLAKLSPLLVPIVVIALWQAATLILPEGAIPTPVETAKSFATGIATGELLNTLWVTLSVVLQAFVIASISGLLVAGWLGMNRFWGDVLGEPLVWLYALPKVVLFPIFLLVFGLGISSRMAFGAVHGFFPLAIFVLAGIRAVPEVYIKVARSLNLGRWNTAFRVILPAILPSVLSGLRFSFSFCFLGVVLAEMFGSKEGAGFELIRLISLHDLPGIFTIALSLMAIAFFINLFLVALESRFAHRGEIEQ